MELFVLGTQQAPSRGGEVWGFVVVAADVLFHEPNTEATFRRSFPSVEVRRTTYRDGGQHQVLLHCDRTATLRRLLLDSRVARAAGTLALRVMRKRATIYSRYHCPQLAAAALGIDREA